MSEAIMCPKCGPEAYFEEEAAKDYPKIPNEDFWYA
jgi:hypothetical protein